MKKHLRHSPTSWVACVQKTRRFAFAFLNPLSTSSLLSIRKSQRLRRTQEGHGSLAGENSAAFPKARPIFQQPFSLPESAQTLAGVAFRAAGKFVRNFPAASRNLPENFSSKEVRTATAFSSFLKRVCDHAPKFADAPPPPPRIQSAFENLCNQKGFGQLKGTRSCYRALGSLYGGIGSPYRPSVPLTGALPICLIVSVAVLGVHECLEEFRSWPNLTKRSFTVSLKPCRGQKALGNKDC